MRPARPARDPRPRPRVWGWALLGLAGLPLTPQGPDPTPVQAEEAPRPVAPAEARIEHFALELTTREGIEVQGVLRWIARREGEGTQLEWELEFPGEELRVLTVETLGPGGDRLVWRELRSGAGRSLVVEWASSDPVLTLREWALDGTSRETRRPSGGALLPLSLIELCRAGRLTQGVFEVLDPTSRGLSRLALSTSYELPREPDGEPRRMVELRRADGTLAGRYRFGREELLDFEWQEGGLRGRRVGMDEHERLRAQRPGPIRFVAHPVPGEGGGGPLGGRGSRGVSPSPVREP